MLSVGQISARLKDSLGVLAGGSRTAEPRQQTLRGALEWRHELLGRLGEEASGAAWAEGRALKLERAVEYALGEEEFALVTPAQPQVGESPSEAFTPREREVVLLVAKEFTNRRIAERLVVSERTVATPGSKRTSRWARWPAD